MHNIARTNNTAFCFSRRNHFFFKICHNLWRDQRDIRAVEFQHIALKRDKFSLSKFPAQPMREPWSLVSAAYTLHPQHVWKILYICPVTKVISSQSRVSLSTKTYHILKYFDWTTKVLFDGKIEFFLHKSLVNFEHFPWPRHGDGHFIYNCRFMKIWSRLACGQFFSTNDLLGPELTGADWQTVAM